MRNMSFFLTTQQFIDHLKEITRRCGWDNLLPGEHFMAVEKAQGLGKGGKIRKLGECMCISNDPEPLEDIIRRPIRLQDQFADKSGQGYLKPEVQREGFPDLTPEAFVKMFCEANKAKDCQPETMINRIHFERLD